MAMLSREPSSACQVDGEEGRRTHAIHGFIMKLSCETCLGMQAMDGGRGDEDFSAVKESVHIPSRPNVDMTVVN